MIFLRENALIVKSNDDFLCNAYQISITEEKRS